MAAAPSTEKIPSKQDYTFLEAAAATSSKRFSSTVKTRILLHLFRPKRGGKQKSMESHLLLLLQFASKKQDTTITSGWPKNVPGIAAPQKNDGHTVWWRWKGMDFFKVEYWISSINLFMLHDRRLEEGAGLSFVNCVRN